ncbi:MAG: KEOPS complex subunit Pcc1 [Infirmifilum sp.]
MKDLHPRYKGCVEVNCGNECEVLFKALYPESGGGKSYRSKVSIERREGALRICIDSGDLASFRAAFNTVLRLLSMIVEVAIIN